MSLAALPASLAVRDIRRLLYRAGWSIGTRKATENITIHWNGPAVDNSSYAAELRQMQGDARWHTRPGAFDVASGGDGIMYHFAVTAQGFILAMRDIEASLWHAGWAAANLRGISIQLPIGRYQTGLNKGKEQRTTAIQWARTVELCDALIDLYKMPGGRSAVKGHREWKNGTDCPGQQVLKQIADYRNGSAAAAAPSITRWQALAELSKNPADNFMAVREAPRKDAKPATDKDGNEIRISPSEIIEVGAVVVDDTKPTSKTWLWLANGAGFTHISGYRPL